MEESHEPEVGRVAMAESGSTVHNHTVGKRVMIAEIN